LLFTLIRGCAGRPDDSPHLRPGGAGFIELFTLVYEPRHTKKATASAQSGLPLQLFGDTSRKEAYALFGIKFDQRQRRLIKELSPRLSDKGFFIFITLDKTELDEAYDYEDELQLESFKWVTQRGVTENDADYVSLRDPTTRVSLFVRHRAKDDFVYLGEMRYVPPHQQFTASDGRTQLRYLFRLEHSVPENLYQRLHGGAAPGGQPRKRRARPSSGRRTRRPTTFGEAREALSSGRSGGSEGGANPTLIWADPSRSDDRIGPPRCTRIGSLEDERHLCCARVHSEASNPL
jgi:Domain of unknown function (DUF3427)